MTVTKDWQEVSDSLAALKESLRLPWTTLAMLWIAREVIRLRLMAICWLAGVDGEYCRNDEHCWGDECGIDVVRFGKVLGTLCYGEGGNKNWVAWLTPNGDETAWKASRSAFDLARELARLTA